MKIVDGQTLKHLQIFFVLQSLKYSFSTFSAEILSPPSAILPLDALKYSENGNPTKPYRLEFPIPILVLALAVGYS